jgi:hypothetical protein
LLLALVFALQAVPRAAVRAQGDESLIYLPVINQVPPPREGLDDFEDQVPTWRVLNLVRQPEAKDGLFRYVDGMLRGEIWDNAARLVASPPWVASGHFKLEVDARFAYSTKKSLDGLGLVFGGNEDFTEYYAFMLAYGGTQHFWGIYRFDGYRAVSIDRDGYIGAPGFVNDWDGWNHLAVIRDGAKILLYCNGKQLRDLGEDYTDSKYGADRLVGLTITSYELNRHDIYFDNFQLTDLE